MTKPNKEDIKKVMSYLGRRSLSTMSKEQRIARAKNASIARFCHKCKKVMKVKYLWKEHYYCEKCNNELSTD